MPPLPLVYLVLLTPTDPFIVNNVYFGLPPIPEKDFAAATVDNPPVLSSSSAAAAAPLNADESTKGKVEGLWDTPNSNNDGTDGRPTLPWPLVITDFGSKHEPPLFVSSTPQPVIKEIIPAKKDIKLGLKDDFLIRAYKKHRDGLNVDKPETDKKSPGDDPSLKEIQSWMEKDSSLEEDSNEENRYPGNGIPIITWLAEKSCPEDSVQDQNGNCRKIIQKPATKTWVEKLKGDGISDKGSKVTWKSADGIQESETNEIPTATFSSSVRRKRSVPRDDRIRNRSSRINVDPTSTERPERPIPKIMLHRSRNAPENPKVKEDADFLEKTPEDTNEDKNTASDGFGYTTRQCDELVPGMVSDGVGGCTKPVKPKKKILHVERRKRDTRTLFIDNPDTHRRQNFTIRISLKGFEKRFDHPTTTTTTTPKPDGGDKAVADYGFGINTSRCNGLVPGLVSDGAGGCTKVIKGIRKRNKFSFILKSSAGIDSVSELDYDNSRAPSQVVTRVDDPEDPEADII